MPRISGKRKFYMKRDLQDWIRITMREKHISQSEMAREIGVSQTRFSILINPDHAEDSDIKFGQLITIFEKLQATDEKIIKLMKV